MNTYPEWFIGGPLHGKDKTEMYPNVHSMVRALPLPEDSANVLGHTVTGDWCRWEDEWHYTPQRFVFGGIVIRFWIDYRYTPREIAATDLAKLIMAPHVKKVSQICTCGDSVYGGRKCPTDLNSGGGSSDFVHCPINKETRKEEIARLTTPEETTS